MTREGGSRKKPSGTRKGAPNESRDSQRNRSGAAAEENEGGSSRKISKSEFKKVILSEEWQLPGFNVNKDEESIECCYAYYIAYSDSFDENMGGDVISLLDCVQRLVASMDEITNPGHNYLRWASALLKPFIGRQADDLHRGIGISDLAVVMYTLMNQLETNNLVKKFAPREIKDMILKLIEIITESPSAYAYGEPNNHLTNDLKDEDCLQYAVFDRSYLTVIQLAKTLRSQAMISLSDEGDNRAKEPEHDLAPNTSEGEEEEEEARAEPKEDDEAHHETQSVNSSTSLMSVQPEVSSAKAIQQAQNIETKNQWKNIKQLYDPVQKEAGNETTLGAEELDKELNSYTGKTKTTQKSQLSDPVRNEQEKLDIGRDTTRTMTTSTFSKLVEQIRISDACSFLAMFAVLIHLNIPALDAVTSSHIVAVLDLLAREAPPSEEDLMFGYPCYTQRLWNVTVKLMYPEQLQLERELKISLMDDFSNQKLKITKYNLKGSALNEAVIELGEHLNQLEASQIWTQTPVEDEAMRQFLSRNLSHGVGTSQDPTMGKLLKMFFKNYNEELERARIEVLKAYDMNATRENHNETERTSIVARFSDARKPEDLDDITGNGLRTLFLGMSTYIRQAVVAWRTLASHLQNEQLSQIKYGNVTSNKTSSSRGAGSTRGGRRGGSKGKGRILSSSASRETETESDGAAETELTSAPVMSALSDVDKTTNRLCHRHLRLSGEPTYTNAVCARRIERVEQTGDQTQNAIKMLNACPGVLTNPAGKHSHQNIVSKVPKAMMDEHQDNCCQKCGTSVAFINGQAIWVGHRNSNYAEPIDQCLCDEDLKRSKRTKRNDLYKNWAEAIRLKKLQLIPRKEVNKLVSTYAKEGRPVAKVVTFEDGELLFVNYQPESNLSTVASTSSLTSGHAERGNQQLDPKDNEIALLREEIRTLSLQVQQLSLNRTGVASSNSAATLSSMVANYGNVNPKFSTAGQTAMPIFLSADVSQIDDENTGLTTVLDAGVNTQEEPNVYPVAVVKEALRKAYYHPQYQQKTNPTRRSYADQMADKFMVYRESDKNRAVQMTQAEILESNTN